MMRYDNNHNVVEENVSVFKYDVNASDIFESTIYDRMHSAENRIDVEIIADEVKDGRLTQVVIHVPDEKGDDET